MYPPPIGVTYISVPHAFAELLVSDHFVSRIFPLCPLAARALPSLVTLIVSCFLLSVW